MYYQSWLTLDLGDDPARPRPTRQVLRNQYLLHQRVYAAFGQQPLENADRGIKKPRGENDNWLLFRVLLTPPHVRVLVRSAKEPDWAKAFRVTADRKDWVSLTRPPIVERVQPQYDQGQVLRFSLRANPTVKKQLPKPDGSPHKNGLRVALTCPAHALHFLEERGEKVTEEERLRVKTGGTRSHDDIVGRACLRWLVDKGKAGGFVLLNSEHCAVIPEGLRLWKKPDECKRPDRRVDLTFAAVLFEGTLKVTDPDAFANALARGIGPAKAFGFGLLSVARV